MDKIWSEFKWLITTVIVLLVLCVIALVVLKCTGVIGGKDAAITLNHNADIAAQAVQKA